MTYHGGKHHYWDPASKKMKPKLGPVEYKRGDGVVWNIIAVALVVAWLVATGLLIRDALLCP